MLPHRRKRRWRCLARQALAALVLLAYLATALGFPLPPGPAKDHSQPFPCQDHACGCRTAQSCWRQCCCFSPEEKLAWADARQLTPPADAERPSDLGWRSAPERERHETKACCRQAQDHDAPARGCGSCCASSAPDEKPARPVGRKVGLSPLSCTCQSVLWVSTGTVPPPSPLTTWRPVLAVIDWLDDRDILAVACLLNPPEPPPRRAA